GHDAGGVAVVPAGIGAAAPGFGGPEPDSRQGGDERGGAERRRQPRQGGGRVVDDHAGVLRHGGAGGVVFDLGRGDRGYDFRVGQAHARRAVAGGGRERDARGAVH